MSVSIAQSRRPLAIFEYSDNGQFIIAKIMQHGDKFSVTEKNAEEWLAHISQEALQGRYDPAWVTQFKLEYEAFQKGNELPREGTPIRTWGAITREQQTRLISMNITTVEDLAAFPDAGLGNLGLDGRVLRDLAKNTLEKGDDLAKRLADAEQANREKDAQLKRLEDRLAAIEAGQTKRETISVNKKAA